MKPVLLFWNLKDDDTKMIVLASFHFANRLIHKTKMKQFIIEL